MDVMRNSLETYFVLLSIISTPWSNLKTLWSEWNLVSSRKFGNTHLHFLPFAVLVLLSDGPPWVNWELSLVLRSVYCLGLCRLGPGTYLWKRIFTGKRFRVPRPRKSPCFTFFPSFVIFNRLKYIVFIKNLIDWQKSMNESPPSLLPSGPAERSPGLRSKLGWICSLLPILLLIPLLLLHLSWFCSFLMPSPPHSA